MSLLRPFWRAAGARPERARSSTRCTIHNLAHSAPPYAAALCKPRVCLSAIQAQEHVDAKDFYIPVFNGCYSPFAICPFPLPSYGRGADQQDQKLRAAARVERLEALEQLWKIDC